MSYLRKIAILALFFNLLIIDSSYAYLDPATGSIILQSIIAGVAVGLGILKLYWHKCKMFWRKLLGKDPTPHG